MAKTVKQLNKQKQTIKAKIADKGGKANAPKLTTKLKSINQKIKDAKKGPDAPGVPSQTPLGPLAGSIDPTKGQTKREEEIIKKIQTEIGVGEDFGRAVGDEFFSDGSLGRIETGPGQEFQDFLTQLKDLQVKAGTRSGETTGLLSQQQADLDRARLLSDLEKESLGIARGALGGLSTQENEALRSLAAENLNRETQASLRELSRLQGGRVRGAAATAQQANVLSGRVQQERLLGRDLIAQNINEKRLAREAFTNLVTQTEQNRTGRTADFSKIFADTLAEVEGREFKQQALSDQLFGSAAQFKDQFVRQGDQFNLDQLAKEKAGQVGSILGGVGTITGLSGGFRAEDFAKELLQKSLQEQNKERQFKDEIINKFLEQQQGIFSQIGGILG